MSKFCLTCSRTALRSWKNWPHKTPIPFLPEVHGPQCFDCDGANFINSDDICWINVHGQYSTGLPDYWALGFHENEGYRRWGRPYLAAVQCRCGFDAVLSEFGHVVPEYAVNCPRCGVVDRRRLSAAFLQQRARAWSWDRISLFDLEEMHKEESAASQSRASAPVGQAPLELSTPERRNIERLARTIWRTELNSDPDSERPNGFCMGFNRYRRGAPASIAGWASYIAHQDAGTPNERSRSADERVASAWLGLNHDWCLANLFYPEVFEDVNVVEPMRVVHALNRLKTMEGRYISMADRELWGEYRREGRGLSSGF